MPGRKVFTQVEIDFLRQILFKTRVKEVTFSLPMPMRGAIFAFGAKIGLKSTKNGVFCILCLPIGG